MASGLVPSLYRVSGIMCNGFSVNLSMKRASVLYWSIPESVKRNIKSILQSIHDQLKNQVNRLVSTICSFLKIMRSFTGVRENAIRFNFETFEESS